MRRRWPRDEDRARTTSIETEIGDTPWSADATLTGLWSRPTWSEYHGGYPGDAPDVTLTSVVERRYDPETDVETEVAHDPATLDSTIKERLVAAVLAEDEREWERAEDDARHDPY